MIRRGKGELGMKSVLDMLDALSSASAGLDSPGPLIEVAVRTSDQTLDGFRGKPNGLGRARIFAEKSIGIDDPGMLAVRVMIKALAG
jgi:dihydroxyacetone kinase-like protein